MNPQSFFTRPNPKKFHDYRHTTEIGNHENQFILPLTEESYEKKSLLDR